MIIEIIGKFFDNHSLSIINRNIAIRLMNNDSVELLITPLDTYDPVHKVDKNTIKKLKELNNKEASDTPDIQVRHCYPPVWTWPVHEKTKVIFIQPWEFLKAPFEWQYKFETFADALIVPSNYEADVFKLGGLNPSNLFVVPNGYDENIFNTEDTNNNHPSVNKDKFNFIYVGNPQWRKGLDILINVWGKAFKKYDNAHLIIKDTPRIYGKNNILSEIIKMQYKSGCAGITYLDDDMSDLEMAELFKSCDIVAHPYRAEGFGMHVQEAIACGCVPIIPDQGPTNDFVPEGAGIKFKTNKEAIDITNGQIFATKPGDAMTLMSSHTFTNEPDGQSVEGALKYVYHHHDKKELFKCISNAELNTWDSVVDKYMEVFLNVGQREKANRFRY
jgi:glycosyltransferase involved in cell wall biosynthesis